MAYQYIREPLSPDEGYRVYGKGKPYSWRCKRHQIPLLARVQPFLDGHLAGYDTFGMTPRTMQRLVKGLANHAHIRRPVTPMSWLYLLGHGHSEGHLAAYAAAPPRHDRLTTPEVYLSLSPEEVLREFRGRKGTLDTVRSG
jgi:hypothetical protein